MKYISGCLVFCAITSAVAFPYGHTVLTHPQVTWDPDSCKCKSFNPPSVNTRIADFNSNTNSSRGAVFSNINMYGGDTEVWSGIPVAYAPTSSQDLATISSYKTIPGVNQVVALVGGTMNGVALQKQFGSYDPCGNGDFYPDLSKMSNGELDSLAVNTGSAYCQIDGISGLQLDMTPTEEPYLSKLTYYFQQLASKLDTCGKTAGLWTVASKMSSTTILSDNSYYIFNIWTEPSSNLMYISPDVYAASVKTQVDHIRDVVGSSSKFSIALPAAATITEYERYEAGSSNSCGSACTDHKNPAKMTDYLNKAMDILVTNRKLFNMSGSNRQFLGVTISKFESQTVYPLPCMWYNNSFYPSSASEEMLHLLMERLPELGAPPPPSPPPSSSSSGWWHGWHLALVIVGGLLTVIAITLGIVLAVSQWSKPRTGAAEEGLLSEGQQSAAADDAVDGAAVEAVGGTGAAAGAVDEV